MTKTSIFGTNENIENKPIEVCFFIKSNGELTKPNSYNVKDWDNIILLISSRTSGDTYDTMYAFTDGAENSGEILLGYWNSGIVE